MLVRDRLPPNPSVCGMSQADRGRTVQPGRRSIPQLQEPRMNRFGIPRHYTGEDVYWFRHDPDYYNPLSWPSSGSSSHAMSPVRHQGNFYGWKEGPGLYSRNVGMGFHLNSRGRMASSMGLGNRWQVNPYTNVMPYQGPGVFGGGVVLRSLLGMPRWTWSQFLSLELHAEHAVASTSLAKPDSLLMDFIHLS